MFGGGNNAAKEDGGKHVETTCLFINMQYNNALAFSHTCSKSYSNMLFLLQPTVFSLLLILAISLAFLFIKRSSPTRTTHKNLPPSPRKLPIIGNLHQLGSSPHRSLRSLSRRHGPLMQLHLGSVPVLVVSSADGAREITKNHDLVFLNRPKVSIPDRLLYGGRDVAFSPYGDYWRQVRSICVLKLLSNKRVQSYDNVREEEAALMLEKIGKISSSCSLVNLSDLFMSLTNDTVCRVALGRKYSGGEGGRKFKELLAQFAELLGVFSIRDYIPWLGWVDKVKGLDGKVEKVAKEFDEFLEGVIKEHTDQDKGEKNGGESDDGGEGQDFVDILLEFQRENKNSSPIHVDTIKALILDMFAAGTDTTHTVLEWGMAELLRHPNVMKKLQDEVRETGRGKPKISEDDLEKMHYLKAVIKETLRLHTPIPLLVPRESTQDVKIMGYDIAAGTQVYINAWAIGRDPSLWEDAEEFRPERFLNSATDYKGFHYQLIPFGAGRRGCPGMLFAMSLNELAVANMVHKFDFTLPDGAEDLDMTETTGITVHKKSPILVWDRSLSSCRADFLWLLGSIDIGDFIPWLSWISRFNGFSAKVDRVAKDLDEFLERVVEERLDILKTESSRGENAEGDSREDFVDTLLRIHIDNSAGISVDRDSIKALILDIFAAGTDTTSAVLEWAMTELIRHPRVMKKVQNKVREIVKGKPERTEADLGEMHYLNAVIKETLRLHPPIPMLVPREARQDVRVMGYDIAAGTLVMTNAWAIGRDPSSWDEPEEFRPERFLNSSIAFKGHDFELIPFGEGRRGCPGTAFAMATNELVLANLVHKFDWTLPGKAKGEDLDIDECTGLTIHRKNPLLAVATLSVY
ncbi:hypothetical protein RJ639_030308 [Escallonia herrerae]|uniref:Cytochrome P450 n=1 Tax=Escallonia herrerae TaxID=1293975 RepID=A0AA89BD57_9ASTE|nr:hypothetical protein RJ639_030308 [Escallonia herrerae]